jgi:hypothetical protein
VYANLGFMDEYARLHMDELLREVEHDRLVLQARGTGRPLRARFASVLYALADRLSDEPPLERGQIVLAN